MWILIQGWKQGQESHNIQPSNLSSALIFWLTSYAINCAESSVANKYVQGIFYILYYGASIFILFIWPGHCPLCWEEMIEFCKNSNDRLDLENM